MSPRPLGSAIHSPSLAVPLDESLFEWGPLPQTCVTLGPDGEELAWRGNEAWRRTFGGEAPWTEPLAHAVFMERVRRQPEGLMVEMALRDVEGALRHLLVTGRLVSVDGGAIVLASYQDVTVPREMAMNYLSDYREMVESAGDTILLLEDNRIIECNAAAERLFGRTRAELIGVHPSIFSPERQEDGQLSATLATQRIADAMSGVRTTFLWQHLRPDGSRFTAEVSFNPARSMTVTGEAARGRFVWVMRDVTEQQAAQAELASLNASLEARVQERTQALQSALESLQRAQGELVRAEKLASLGALVAGVAHELNTPIGNAVMVSSTLRDLHRQFERTVASGLKRSALSAFQAEGREALEVIERNLRRAAELITSFKQIAVDQSSYQRRPFELGEVLHELNLMLSPTLRRAQVALIDAVQPGLRMDSYPGPLTQVLMNLVDNAVMHAFEAPHSRRQVRITGEAVADRGVRITVADNGQGIPAELLPRVFDPFVTTKLGRGGSGLGLHIVYTLVTDLLGGRVAVDSEVGQGCTFTIDLPRHAPQPVSQAAVAGFSDG